MTSKPLNTTQPRPDVQVAGAPELEPGRERRKNPLRRSVDQSGKAGAAPSANARLRAADDLIDKQRLLSEAQRIARIGSWWQDRSGRLVWSDEMYQIHGVAAQEFSPSAEGRPALIHPDDRTAVREKVAAAFDGGVVADFEFRVVRPDGAERWVVARTEGAANPAGEIGHLTGTYQDITEQRQAKAAVYEAAARYRQLFDANPYPMWIYDPATLRFLAVNDAAVGKYGYPRDEFLGMTMNDLSPPESLPSLVDVKRELGAGHSGDSWQHRIRDGRLIDMEIIAQTIDFEGRPARVVLAHDVTERRRAAQDVLASREALRALVQRQQSAQEEERARMSRHVHDELGQLLTSLKMELYLVERKISAPGLPLGLHALLDHSVAACALVDEAITTVQKLAAELRPGALDHLGLPAALAQRARQFQQSSGVACTLEVADSLPELPPSVANELFYICQEALTNVARHAQATQVRLRLHGQMGGVRLEVEDNGVGIAARAMASHDSLGLLGMRERALHCRGTVQLANIAPHGTLVVVDMPLREADT
ncbi:MAG: PAS domain S-box protein [Rhodoferax sp.]|nr:PAS domain S-box protein [Rhodoferax sp.]